MLIRLHASDNVLIAKSQVAIGQELPGLSARARAQIPAGHKVAASPIAKGQPVRKYNAVIGVAARDIETGDYVHTHNLAFVDFDRDPGFGLDVRPVTYVPEAERATFQGYVREDGRVGTRNFIGLISSVNCSATAISRIAAHFTPERLKDFPNVDGVAAFPKPRAAACPRPARTLICCDAHWQATRATPTWPACSSSAWVVNATRWLISSTHKGLKVVV